MKYPIAIVSVVLLLLLSGIGVWWIIKNKESRWSGYSSKTLVIESKEYQLWIADTVWKHYQGLSDLHTKSELDGKDGMVFEFERKGIESFVNRRTYLDLTVVWMDGIKVIGTDTLPKLDTANSKEVIVTSPGAVNRVVELVR